MAVAPAADLIIIICLLKTNHGFPGLGGKVMVALCLSSFPDEEREQWLSKHIEVTWPELLYNLLLLTGGTYTAFIWVEERWDKMKMYSIPSAIDSWWKHSLWPIYWVSANKTLFVWLTKCHKKPFNISLFNFRYQFIGILLLKIITI